jgi:ADP-ribose pyrophosphatase YjhB (NUDIX family)
MRLDKLDGGKAAWNTAVTCYLRARGEILFKYQRDKRVDGVDPGYHIGIGGKRLNFEGLDECMERILQESTSLKAKEMRLSGRVQVMNLSEDTWNIFVYAAEGFTGTVRKNFSKNRHIWVEESNLKALKLHDGDRLFLPYVFDARWFHASLSYDASREPKELVKAEIQFPPKPPLMYARSKL